jgi:hypothetical protein
MKFRLFQIAVPDEEFDAVNDLGWSEAMAKFPRVEASQAVRVGGSKAFVPQYNQYYVNVSDIEATDLENAFFVHNNPFGDDSLEEQITRYAKQYSMSVGDILVDEDGKSFIVDNFGFEEVDFEVAA